MEPNENESQPVGLLDRFRKSWFPPAAVFGALAAFVAATFRVRPEPKANYGPTKPAGSPKPSDPLVVLTEPPGGLERKYTRTAVLAGSESAHPFQSSLAGIAIGAGDSVYALGDDEVRVFGPAGALLRAWKVSKGALCLAVDPKDQVYLGIPGRVEIYDAAGRPAGGFAVGDKANPAGITAIKAFRNQILVADASSRLIRRYDTSGNALGLIGDKTKTGSFILPNGWLDFDVDAEGMVCATDTGRHLVTTWTLEGEPVGSFGRFGMSDPTDFVGCCNPVNLATAPDGMIVTGEKMVARVKVYEPGGRLLAVIGPENFDPDCTHIFLDVDSKGRILAADPVRRQIAVYSLVGEEGE
jgi:hypothetical protein